MMGRTKKKGDNSPTSNTDIAESSKSSVKSKASPNSTLSEQSLPPQRSLYADIDDSDSGIDDINAGKSGFANAAKALVGISKDSCDFDTEGDDFDELNNNKVKIACVLDEPIPDTIGSIQDVKMAESVPSSTQAMHSMGVQKYYNDARKMSVNLKAMLITNIRTTVFRRIKFLTNEKLGRESSVCQLLFQATGITNPVEQIAKYEDIRQLAQRQMNSKRNYCTEQIMTKARELLKADKMFDFDEIDHFYRDEYFESEPTRLAWFIYCYKFLACVNGEWLRAINPANARNQVNLLRYITVSDEAFVRWVLEVKKRKLLEEKRQGWPIASAVGNKRKPNGMHESRQFSHLYAEIHSEVKKRRSLSSSQQWNNLFWSIYMVVKPKLFVDPSSVACESLNGIVKVHVPDEDEYEPENQKVDTICFPIKQDDTKNTNLIEHINSVVV